ncbi:MAG: 50S ribosomal protein L18 [Microgenomates group bacterium GW2011_GWF2_45_18]|nr:MAG: 50S ribosomal protein L18 [Microgenomates group bacterium GW2011_GWF1_44_10]KKU01982.1 MAG: 50S ribosomal protein L18 [Microgenomates group bacterium GW2011_GWF2_45_18]HAU99032.1 50S ribosomal protein L18 [Candidatus Paceibacterota bacterium]HAX01253.1 50S ribosomal protein L18 [Candidatus Paceibacterota bacterium]
MSKVNHQLTRADHRKLRVRGKISGSASRPRLSVFRSNKYTYLQAIDDENSVTLFSATESEIQDGGTKSERAKKITQVLVEKAKKAKVEAFVFDRGSYRYHGRVKLIAEAMREAGMKV